MKVWGKIGPNPLENSIHRRKIIIWRTWKFIDTIYHCRGSLNFLVHAGGWKKCGKDYNLSGNPAKFVARSMQCFPQLTGIGKFHAQIFHMCDACEPKWRVNGYILNVVVSLCNGKWLYVSKLIWKKSFKNHYQLQLAWILKKPFCIHKASTCLLIYNNKQENFDYHTGSLNCTCKFC